MFTFITGLFGKSKLDGISLFFIVGLLALLAVIVLPNLSQLSEKLGFQTMASLRVDKANLTANVNTVTQALKETTVAKHNAEEVGKLGVDTAIKVEAKKQVTAKKFESNKVKLTVATESVKAQIKNVATEAQVRAISVARIDFVWDNYDAAVAASSNMEG